jgi:hypothetical protein
MDSHHVLAIVLPSVEPAINHSPGPSAPILGHEHDAGTFGRYGKTVSLKRLAAIRGEARLSRSQPSKIEANP